MIRQRLLWVTDMVVMANVHKVLLSFTDSVLGGYMYNVRASFYF